MSDAIPPQIHDLLERRSTYLDWLERLEDAAKDASPEVVGRIREDYEERLAEVRTELAAHHGELADSLEKRTAKLERLEADRDEHLARREEAEIRYQVGEFGEDEWSARREELDQSIDELGTRMDEEKEAIEDLRTALDAMEEAPAPDASSDRSSGAEGPPPLRLVDGEEEEAQAEAAAPANGERPPGPGDQEEAAGAAGEPAAAFQSDTAGSEPRSEEDAGEEGAEEEEPGPPAGAPGSREAPGGAYDELEFLESLSLEDADQFDAVSAMLDGSEERDEGEPSAEDDRDSEEGSSRRSNRDEGG